MVDKNAHIEKIVFKKLIQTQLDFYVLDGEDKNIIKSGKLINYRLGLPFLFFNLEYKTTQREFPLPQPFQYKWDNGKLIFSYRIEDLKMDRYLEFKMKKLAQYSDCKYFNKLLYIEPLKIK